jgi:hypothetical protein
MIPERDRIKIVMTPEEIAEALESGDYSAEMLMQHLIRHHNRLERELEQEQQDRKQAELDVCRALGERNDARAIIDATLKALPVGYIPAHTPESLPGRVADLVSELGRLTAMLEDPAEVELAMIRGDIAIPDRVEFDAVRTPVGYNPSPTDP